MSLPMIFDVDTVAKYLGVTKRTVQRCAKRLGKKPGLIHQIRFTEDEVKRMAGVR